MTFIFKKELRHLFGGIRSFVCIAILLLLCGIYTVSQNMLRGNTELAATLMGTFPALVIALPMLSAPLFTQERGANTQGLLYSLALRPIDIALGKLAATCTVFAIPAVLIAILPLLFTSFGQPDMAQVYFSWFGYVLLGIALLSLCLFLSLFFKNAWITYALSAGVLLALYLLQLLISKIPTAGVFSFVAAELLFLGVGAWLWLGVRSRLAALISAILPLGSALLFVVRPQAFASLLPRLISKLNPFSRYVGFIYGRFDLEGIVYLLSFSVFFVFLTVLIVAYRRDEEV